MTHAFDFTAGSIRVMIPKGSSQLRIDFLGIALSGVGAQVVLLDGTREDVVWKEQHWARGGMELQGTAAGGRWTLRVEGEENARGVPGVRLTMSGTTHRGRPIRGLVSFALPRMAADHVLVHGRSAGGCRAWMSPKTEEMLESHCLLMVRRGERVVQLAQPLRQDNPALISGRYKGATLREVSVATQFAHEEGVGHVEAVPLSIFVDPDGHALMEAWAEAQVPEGHCLEREREPVAGWNSWDYYRWTVSEEAVLCNAEFIASDPVLSRHVKRLIIDDGWQYAYGEWEANPHFPHGMAWMAKRLTKMGFEPGLWMAPGVVEPHAHIAQWDSDMLACGLSGLPCLCYRCMERYGFVLDPTVPKTQKWLHDLYRRYADMGYRYFKADFLMPVTTAPLYNDPSVPRGQIIRMLLQPIRNALQGRAQLMGCGYDFHAGMDLVDEVRTSTDIHARWDSICDNVGSIATRWWAQGRWWGNDPDFALARGPETSDDPDLTRLKACLVFVPPEATKAPQGEYPLATMNRDEARTLLGLVVISGGSVTLSDDVTKLNAEGLDLLRRTVSAPRGDAGVALDLFRAVRPSQWLQRTEAGNRMLLINWSDEPRESSLDLRALGIHATSGIDFWTEEVIPISNGILSRILAPHASVLVEIKRGG